MEKNQQGAGEPFVAVQMVSVVYQSMITNPRRLISLSLTAQFYFDAQKQNKNLFDLTQSFNLLFFNFFLPQQKDFFKPQKKDLIYTIQTMGSKPSSVTSTSTASKKSARGMLLILGLNPDQWQQIKISELKFIKDPDGIKDQGQEGTCYAQATVTCIRCAEVRLNLKYPQNAGKLYLQRIIGKFGKEGAHIFKVLSWALPQHNLKFKKIESGNPTYDGAVKQKIELIKMYLKKMIPVLIVVCWSKEPLNYKKKVVNLKQLCHAMVIMEAEDDYWKVQNSWGENAHSQGIVKLHHESYIREAYIVYGQNEDV